MTLPGKGGQVKRQASDRYVTLRLKVSNLRPVAEIAASVAASYGAYVDQGTPAVIPVFAVTLAAFGQYRRRR
jgi:hypothetical protein